MCCGYSLEAPRRGNSHEYPQHTFLWRTMENYPLIIIKHPPCLFHCNFDTWQNWIEQCGFLTYCNVSKRWSGRQRRPRSDRFWRSCEQSDLGLLCFPRPVCPNICDDYSKVASCWSASVYHYEPRHEKTCLQSFQPGKTRTGLLS